MADEQDQDLNSEEQADQSNSQAETFEIDGQKLTAEQLAESYKNLKSDYTKKSQALKQFAEQGLPQTAEQPTELDQIADALAPILEKRGFAKQTDISKFSESAKMEKIISENPTLAKNKKILEGLMKAEPNRPIEEIVHEYGLNGTDPLQKGGSDVMGEPNRQPKEEVDIAQMDAKQLAEWEAKQGIGKKAFKPKPNLG